MSTVQKSAVISIAEYLAGEAHARRKHEYVNGDVYAQAGGTNAHNLIASNVLIEIGIQLRGKPCTAYNSDAKVRVRRNNLIAFYYPDAMVVCKPNPPTDSYQDHPAVIVEVVSESTRRIDQQEKRDAYLSLPSCDSYIMLEQSSATAVVYQRGANDFDRRVYHGPDAAIPLPTIGCELSLAAIYDSVEFTPEVEGDEVEK